MENIAGDQLERRALDFMALLLRLQDMYLQNQERTRNTFADDVASKLEALNLPDLSIESGIPVYPDLSEVVPDYVLRREGITKPLALFLASGNEKLWQAMHLQMRADYEVKKPVSVIALLETGHSGSQKLRDQASNRIAAIPNWKGDETAAFQRILRELEVPNSRVN